MAAANQCQLLEWDTDFFGRRIAQLNAQRLDPSTMAAALAWCADQQIDGLYLLCDAADTPSIRQAEINAFQLMDLRHTLAWQGGSAESDIEPAADTRPVAAQDIVGLAAIARVSHRDSRFYADPQFAPEQCDALYAAWIEQSCAGYADVVLVAGPVGAPTGYISCHRAAPSSGKIGLLAVAAAARGRGLGVQLIRAAQRWFAEHELQDVTVVTQGRNLPAQRLYQRCGFVTRSQQLWYHAWFRR
jgi:dTDP-4-amino-4,6-dideoxy-D-galactose acyltransferase